MAIVRPCMTYAGLPFCVVRSHAAMFSTFTDYECLLEALTADQEMQEYGAESNSYALVRKLKDCGRGNDVVQGMRLHADACKENLSSDVFVGSTLVSMYGKCGALVEAADVFSEVMEHNIVSWNAMLSAYIEKGEAKKALLLYRQMESEGVNSDARTFVMALQACGILAEEVWMSEHVDLRDVNFLDIGQALHAKAHLKGLASNVFVGSTLASMYGKCGALSEAYEVLISLKQRNVVSWNAILSVHVDQGDGKMALLLYRQMQQDGVVPDQLTFATSLQACCALVEKDGAHVCCQDIGRALHLEVCKRGFLSDVVVGSTLLNMYSKCSGVADAEDMFFKLSQRNTVWWNLMLSTYINQGQGGKALRLYRQMQEDGITFDQLTLTYAIQACANFGAMEECLCPEQDSITILSLEIAMALHSYAGRKGFMLDVFLGNTLISTYGKCGAMAEAQHVFHAIPKRDVVSWNALMSGLLDTGLEKAALQCHQRMQVEGVCPDRLTFVLSLRACDCLVEKDVHGHKTHLTTLEMVKALHADAAQHKLLFDVALCSGLLSSYAKCGAISEAENVFGSFLSHDTILYNAMLSAYVEQGQSKKVLALYREMQEQVLTMDVVTLIYILLACGVMASLEALQELHFYVVCGGFNQVVPVAAASLHAYATCATMVDARAVLDELVEPDLVSWNASIAGYAGVGYSIASLHLFETLRLTGHQADDSTFSAILLACSHGGLLEGCEYFVFMTTECGIVSDKRHLGSMVDILGRAGDFKRLKNMLQWMTVEVDATILTSVMSACRIHGFVGLAKEVFDFAVSVDLKEDSIYITMSCIYAIAGLLDHAAMVDSMRTEQNVQLGLNEKINLSFSNKKAKHHF